MEAENLAKLLNPTAQQHIDIHEMAKLLNMLGKKVTKSELDEIFSTIDPDGSGEVDFDEFFAWFSSAGM